MSSHTLITIGKSGGSLLQDHLETLFFSNLDYEPFRNSALGVEIRDGCLTFLPPAEPFQASLLLPVSDFGSTYVYADNEGKGYSE